MRNGKMIDAQPFQKELTSASRSYRTIHISMSAPCQKRTLIYPIVSYKKLRVSYIFNLQRQKVRV